MELINDVVGFLINTIQSGNLFLSIIIGLLSVILESIIPILPLALFIATNVLVFGKISGFILSWIGTIIGCIISFTAFREGFSKYLYKKVDTNKIGIEIMDSISNISFPGLVLVTAMPFTPAFLVNIASGLSKMSFKKYLCAMLIAKVSIVYFWGFIGTTFVESMGDLVVILRLGFILLITYIISKIVCKKFNIR